MAKRILVVDDETYIVEILTFNLQREGYEVLTAANGREGLALARTEKPDLILLDIMMPEMDGFAVCEELRKEDKLTPIIMLTAREEEADRVSGLELGADDYVSKPFSVKELMARVKTNLRRNIAIENTSETAKASERERQRIGCLMIDSEKMQISKNGRVLELTQREYELLCFLAASVGTVFPRETLAEKVWNYQYLGDSRSVDVAVRRLREKIEDDPQHPTLLCTRRGAGYYLSGV